MLKIVRTIFDSIFPPRATELRVRGITTEKLWERYQPRSTANITYLLSYQDPLVTALITENKFHQNVTAATHLATVLTDWLITTNEPVTLIPIPLSSARRRSRGYNQVEEILKRLPPTYRDQCQTTVLIRNTHTKAQTSLTRADRLTNVQGAFSISPHAPFPTGTIVIIDDVITTGATLIAAKAALLAYEPTASIRLLGIAH